MNDEILGQITPQSKKRDASSPLQESAELIKKHKQYKISENSIDDISESFTDLSDCSDTEPSNSDISVVTCKPDMASNIPRLSDDDVDRIALRVQAIMMPSMKAMIDTSIGELKTEYDRKMEQLESENEELKSDLCTLRVEVENMKWRDDELEQYSRRNSIRISGIQESDARTTDEIVLSISDQYGINATSADIDRSHRVGKIVEGKNRAVLVKFTSFRARREFMIKKQDLDEGLYFNKDLTKLHGELLYESRKLFKADRLHGAWSFGGRVYVKDTKGDKHEIKSVTDVKRLASRVPVKLTLNRNAASNQTPSYRDVVSRGEGTPIDA